MYANFYGHLQCVELLLQNGSETDITDSYGSTALMFAAYDGHAACVKILIDYNANVDMTNDAKQKLQKFKKSFKIN